MKPQGNTLIDLNIVQCHNLQVIYDRQQVLGLEVQTLKQQLSSLELTLELQHLQKQLKEGFGRLANQITGIIEIFTVNIQKIAEQVAIEAKKPKAEESQTLNIAENLETQISEVKRLIEKVEGLIPS